MRKILAINGSGREGWNTHLLLKEALKGAKDEGAQTEIINLSDMEFRGCIGCLTCKRKVNLAPDKCVLMDKLTPVLEKAKECDALIIGSPIFFGDVTGLTRCFMERLLFPLMSYEEGFPVINKKKKPTAFFFTMNVPEEALEELGYLDLFERNRGVMERIFGSCEILYATETLQVRSYNQYKMSAFNEAERRERRAKVFPLDLKKAFEIGKRVATGTIVEDLEPEQPLEEGQMRVHLDFESDEEMERALTESFVNGTPLELTAAQAGEATE